MEQHIFIVIYSSPGEHFLKGNQNKFLYKKNVILNIFYLL